MSLDQPLSDKEFEELDQFLLSERCSDDAMTMDCLHGYLTAIAIGPETILMSEWLPRVWGENRTAPDFKNDKECARIIQLIVRFMNEIVVTFEVAPKEFEPLFCEQEVEGQTLIDGEAWAWGFYEGMNLRAEAWELILTSDVAPMMRPIYLLGADEIAEEEMALVDDPVSRHKLAIEVESNIQEIYRFWLPHRKSAMASNTVKRDVAKVGRNEDCSCGSGKKFKKCCGVQTTLH